MAKRNRSSQMKREREQKKRDRQRRKDEKAAMKRERRFGNSGSGEAGLPDPRPDRSDGQETGLPESREP